MAHKRIVAISDLHCGHRVGLTPPAYQRRELAASDRKDAKYYKAAIELWNVYDDFIQELQPIDILLCNGDAIDGSNNATELITTDRKVQVDIATECLLHAKAETIVLTYGTGFHTGRTGKAEDWEEILAEKVEAQTIDSELFLDVNGCIIKCRHFIERSKIFHGRFTPVSRQALENVIAVIRGEEPLVDLFLFSHVHYNINCGEPNRWQAITLPALQGKESKFGSRVCGGTVDFGVTRIDVEDDGAYNWQCYTALVESQKARVIKL